MSALAAWPQAVQTKVAWFLRLSASTWPPSAHSRLAFRAGTFTRTDRILGGDGDDTLSGGPGQDRLRGGGGGGAERFEFARHGWNALEDFDAAEGDLIGLASGMWEATHGALDAAQVVGTFGRINAAGDAVLDFGAAGTVVAVLGPGTLDGLSGSLLIL